MHSSESREENMKKQTSNKRPNALLKLIQNLSIRGYYRSTYLFPSLFLGGCVTGLNDSIAGGILKKYNSFQMESGKKIILTYT